MRLATLASVALLAGCLFGHGEMHATPCRPAGEPTFGTLRVHVPDVPGDGLHAMPAGKCVALQKLADGERILATARIADDGNATLNLPVDGEVYISWTSPDPHDRACAAQGYAFVTVPGPANVTLQVGGVCY